MYIKIPIDFRFKSCEVCNINIHVTYKIVHGHDMQKQWISIDVTYQFVLDVSDEMRFNFLYSDMH